MHKRKLTKIIAISFDLCLGCINNQPTICKELDPQIIPEIRPQLIFSCIKNTINHPQSLYKHVEMIQFKKMNAPPPHYSTCKRKQVEGHSFLYQATLQTHSLFIKYNSLLSPDLFVEPLSSPPPFAPLVTRRMHGMVLKSLLNSDVGTYKINPWSNTPTLIDQACLLFVECGAFGSTFLYYQLLPTTLPVFPHDVFQTFSFIPILFL